MKNVILFLLAGILVSCQSGEAPSGADAPASGAPDASVDLSSFTQTPVPGTKFVRAQRKDAQGNLAEEGLLYEGKRSGTWITYHKAPNYPKIIASYIEGKFNGPYLEFDENRNFVLQAFYENNLLHGSWARYQYGALAYEAGYARGKLDGFYIEYRGNGSKAKEISYKDGELDGPYRFFDEQGKAVLEYQYRKGKKL